MSELNPESQTPASQVERLVRFLRSLPFHMIQQVAYGVFEFRRVVVNHFTGTIATAFLVIIGCLVFCQCGIESPSFPPYHSASEANEIVITRSFRIGCCIVHELEQHRMNLVGNVIKFFSAVSPQREAMASDHADAEGQNAEKFDIVSEERSDIEHALFLIGCFVAGLYCGGAFGAPTPEPLSRIRRRIPDSSIER